MHWRFNALYIVPIQSLQSALNMKDFSAKYLALKAKATIPNDLLLLNGESYQEHLYRTVIYFTQNVFWPDSF